VEDDWCHFVIPSEDADLVVWGDDNWDTSGTHQVNRWEDMSAGLTVPLPVSVIDQALLGQWLDGDATWAGVVHLASEAAPGWTPTNVTDRHAGAHMGEQDGGQQVDRVLVSIPAAEMAVYILRTTGSATFQWWLRAIGFRHKYRN
jgi:hypothetical protein